MPYSLHDLAALFESAEQRSDHNGTEVSGWGQFLDTPKLHEQIGLYGTAAGLIVLELANRGQSVVVRRGNGKLRQSWEEYDQGGGYGYRKLSQTTRHAVCNLALRLSSPPNDVAVRAAEQSLARRVQPSALWGDYWLSADRHDQTPRLFASAIAVLSFTLFRDPQDPLPAEVIAAANEIERQLAAQSGLAVYIQMALGAAVLSVKGSATARHVLNNMSRLADRHPINWGHQEVYFYDVEQAEERGAPISFSRDYLIVPEEFFFVICGLQESAPSRCRLRAESSQRELWQLMQEHGGLFRPARGERVGCMNQAWAGMALEAGRNLASSPGILDKIIYSLLRHRKDSWVTGTALPFLSVLWITALGVAVQSGGLWYRITATLCMLVISSIYGKAVFEKTIGRIIGRN